MQIDAFKVAQVEQVGIGGRELCTKLSGGLRCDAVGHAHGTACPVVAARPEVSGRNACRLVDDLRVEQTELGKIERSPRPF
jgi:hypothetical protein